MQCIFRLGQLLLELCCCLLFESGRDFQQQLIRFVSVGADVYCALLSEYLSSVRSTEWKKSGSPLQGSSFVRLWWCLPGLVLGRLVGSCGFGFLDGTVGSRESSPHLGEPAVNPHPSTRHTDGLGSKLLDNRRFGLFAQFQNFEEELVA